MDHEHTSDTPVSFHVEITRGTCETEILTLGEFLTHAQIVNMSREDIELFIAREHANWVLEQVQDGACFNIG